MTGLTTMLQKLFCLIGLSSKSRTESILPNSPIPVLPPRLINASPANPEGDQLVMDEEGRFLFDTTLRYPPYDTGIPFISLDRILNSQSEMIRRIRILCDNDHRMLSIVDVLIENYARYVHLIPVTRSAHYHGPGGLFRYGLQMGYFAMRGKEGLIWTAKDLTYERGALEKKWSIAAFIAGLCSEVYLTVSNMIVLDQHDHQWHPFLSPLTEWLEQNQVHRYFLRWLDQPSQRTAGNRSVSTYIISKIIPQDILDFLATDDRRIIIDMMNCLMTQDAVGKTTLETLIARTKYNVIEADLNTHPSHFGKPTVGVHLHPYIVDAIRQLTRSGRWKVNANDRIWISEQGVWIVWTDAVAREIAGVLSDYPGIPQDAMTIADVLIDGGAAIPSSPGSALWKVIINKGTEPRSALKLSRPEVLFESISGVSLVNVEVLQPTENSSVLDSGIVVAGTYPSSFGDVKQDSPHSGYTQPANASSEVGVASRSHDDGHVENKANTSLHSVATKFEVPNIPEFNSSPGSAGVVNGVSSKNDSTANSPSQNTKTPVEKQKQNAQENITLPEINATNTTFRSNSARSALPTEPVPHKRHRKAKDYEVLSTGTDHHASSDIAENLSTKNALHHSSIQSDIPAVHQPLVSKPLQEPDTSLLEPQNRVNEHDKLPTLNDVTPHPSFAANNLQGQKKASPTKDFSIPPLPSILNGKEVQPPHISKQLSHREGLAPGGAPLSNQSATTTGIPEGVNLQALGGSFRMALFAALQSIVNGEVKAVSYKKYIAIPLDAIQEGVSRRVFMQRLMSAGIVASDYPTANIDGAQYLLLLCSPSILHSALSREIAE
jgi:hypothetical protein